MNYRFYAELPSHFNSKGGCKQHEPFTRKTLERVADPNESFRDGTRGVSVIAVCLQDGKPLWRGPNLSICDVIASDVFGYVHSTASGEYLSERCVRISRGLAFHLDPALFNSGLIEES